jgi:hypothetical protein
VNLKVTNNGIDFADEAVDFEYVNLPSISKIQPERGPIGVQIQVTIHGSGFIEGSTWCRSEGEGMARPSLGGISLRRAHRRPLSTPPRLDLLLI